MSEQSTRPELTAAIDSAGEQSTIFVTADAAVNDITLTIGSTADGPTVFQPAPVVVDKSQAPTATGSLLYLDLTPLSLTDAEFTAIKPADPNWTIVGFAGQRILGMTPVSPLTVPAHAVTTVKIGPLAAAHATGASASLVLSAYRVSPVTVANLAFPAHLSVALATPPNGGEQLSQDVALELVTPDVVNSVSGYDPVANQLSLAFIAGSRGRPVTATADTQFTISFVYASDPSGYGALCTIDEGKQVSVVAGTGAAGWTITPNRGQQYPSWTLRPPPGSPIVGSGVKSVVGFLVENLVTTFQPGPTVALVSYSGLPGYADGVYPLLISKHPHVRITALKVTPADSVLKDGAAEVEISWTAEDAGTMTLAPFNVDVTGKTSYKATITETTPVTLTAQGTYLASLGNIALANAMAYVLPVINSFTASPSAVYAGDLPRDVALSWNVNTPDQLQLLSSVGPPDPTKYAAAGTIGKPVAEPQMFTLLPLGQSHGPVVQRSIVVSAFTPQVRAWPTGAARYLAAPSNASYVLVSDGDSTVTALDTLVYKPVSDNVPAGSKPAGMVFSADGTRLYVANSGDGTVSVISVQPVAGTPTFSFTATGTVTVGGSPRELALSPDGRFLYVTVDNGTQNGQLAVLSLADVPIPVLVDALTVGLAPRGVAVLPSGAMVFVANSADGTVSVVGRTKDNEHQLGQPITGVGSATDVGVSGDGNVLLVTCPAANAVTAINVVHPTAPRAQLVVGAAPQRLVVLPSGAYAAVTSSDSNIVALLAVGGTPSQCRVLGSGIDVGTTTSSVAITPDAGLLLLGGASGLLVATLAEYETAGALPAIGGQPTDVRVSPDGGTALAWHNTLRWIGGGKPSTGLFAYDVASRTVTRHLNSTKVVDVAYHPSAAVATAFLIDSTGTAVQLVSTQSWTVTGTIDLAGQTTGSPIALAVSADGTTLCVLATGDAGAQVVVFGRPGGSPWTPLGTVTVTPKVDDGASLTLSVGPDGTRAYVTDQTGGALLVVAKDKSGKYALYGNPVPIGDYPNAAALSPDGTRLYIACGGVSHGTLVAVSTDTLSVRTVPLPSNGLIELAGLTVSPDGNRVLATDLINTGVRIFDAASLRLVQSVSWESGAQMVSGIAVSPDASRIFTANIKTGNLGVIGQVQGGSGLDGGSLGATSETPLGAATYQGLFIRDQVGQTPDSGAPAGVLTNCPDIWPSGELPLPNPKSTLVDGYMTDSPNQIFTSVGGTPNYIYVRGKNTVNGPHTVRIWLYYINAGGDPSLVVWPNNWMNGGLAALDTGKGYIDVASAALNEVSYTYPPFVWNAVPFTGHYCMLAWVENDPDDNPDDPRDSIGYIGSFDQLAQFISSHPNLGWKNTIDVPSPAKETWTKKLSLTGPPKGGKFNAGIQLTGIPTDASFAFSIVGPDPTNPNSSVNVPKTPVTDKNQTYMVPIDWTGHPNYSTSMELQYWAGTTQPDKGGNITTVAAANTKKLVGLVDDPLARSFLADMYPNHGPALKERRLGQTWLTEVGSVTVNLT
jgi:YVTN family beta-propeller protein